MFLLSPGSLPAPAERRRRWLVAALLAALGGQVSAAMATERQWRAGMAAGAAWLDGAEPGAGGGFQVSYGLSDVWDMGAILRSSLHGTSGRSAKLFAADLALAARFDIVRWVPHAELATGLHYFSAGGASDSPSGAKLGGILGYGIDYSIDRELSLGVAAEHQLVWDDGVRAPIFFPHLRFEYRWGF